MVQAPAQPAGSKQNTSQARISGCDRKAHGIDERTCPMLPVMRTFLGRVLVLRARLAALAAARICIGLEKACGLLSGSGGFVGVSAERGGADGVLSEVQVPIKRYPSYSKQVQLIAGLEKSEIWRVRTVSVTFS